MNINNNSQILSDSVRYLSPRQQRAIIFLISCPTQEEVCSGAGVTRETVHKWMKDPVFREELEKKREAVFSEALSTLKQSVNQAVDTLRNLLNSENESIRLRASLHFLRLGLKVREEIELEAQLGNLEKSLQARFLKEGFSSGNNPRNSADRSKKQ